MTTFNEIFDQCTQLIHLEALGMLLDWLEGMIHTILFLREVYFLTQTLDSNTYEFSI
jgi:hypothetical protein